MMNNLITLFILSLFFGCNLQDNKKALNKKIAPTHSSMELRNAEDTLSGKKINAHFAESKPAVYLIDKMKDGKMELRREQGGETSTLYLKGDSVYYENASASPFHQDHNRWRIKPVQKENKEQIIARLKEYVGFYIEFFDDNLKRNTNSINFEGLPCCFNWYKGGIGVQNKTKLDPKFTLCFYDNTQAEEARLIMEEVILKKYNWVADVDNWVEQTLPVLRQVRDSL